MSKHIIEIVKISPCIISDDKPYSRTAPREEHQQSDDYREKFDYKTLSFDTFYAEDKVILSGPPLYGLEEFIEHGEILLDDQSYTGKIHTTLFDRTQSNHITNIQEQPHELTWKYQDIVIKTQINNNFLDQFKSKKVLFTLSKNNKFEWIYDWIMFYTKYHHIDAVLFYDNNSDNYSLGELKDYLYEKNLDVDVYLVPWNFKYGPQGGIYSGTDKAPWDSDFCQYGMFEHAKHRFLKYSSGVINADIDELVITPNEKSIFELLADYKGLLYPGHWIQSIPLDKSKDVRFFNYAYKTKNDQHSDNKWCINPSKLDDKIQWKVHSIRKTTLKSLEGVYYAHFKAINYNWKTQRVDTINYDESKHYIDQNVYSQFCHLFPHETPKIALPISEASTNFFSRFKTLFKS